MNHQIEIETTSDPIRLGSLPLTCSTNEARQIQLKLKLDSCWVNCQPNWPPSSDRPPRGVKVVKSSDGKWFLPFARQLIYVRKEHEWERGRERERRRKKEMKKEREGRERGGEYEEPWRENGWSNESKRTLFATDGEHGSLLLFCSVPVLVAVSDNEERMY